MLRRWCLPLASPHAEAATTTSPGRAGATRANLIKPNPANNGIQLTVGSKNFTEEYILGKIYAQALEAAGYKVKTNLNLGSEAIALKALKDGEITGYPGVHLDALTSASAWSRTRSRRRPAGVREGEAELEGRA